MVADGIFVARLAKIKAIRLARLLEEMSIRGLSTINSFLVDLSAVHGLNQFYR